MPRRFNVTGSCNPKLHYMVDIRGRLEKIRELIDNGSYFTINRARQYGKTTTLAALGDYLKNDYMVVSLDFQMLGNADFSTEIVFARAFVRYLLRTIRNKRKPIYLYNLFLSEEEVSSAVYATAVADKYQFVKGGHLDHRLSIN